MSIISDKPFTFDRVIRIGITLFFLWALIKVLGLLSDVLIPFAIAALLAYLINPLVKFIQEKCRVRKRGLSVLISLVVVFVLVFMIFWFVIPLIINEIAHMGELLKKLVNESGFSEQKSKYIPVDIWQFLQDFVVREDVQKFFNADSFGSLASAAVQKILPGVWSVFSGAINIILGVFGVAIIILYLIFLLADYDTIFKGSSELLPAEYKEKVINFVDNFKEAMHNYFRAQALIAFCVGVLFAIGFWIIGLPMGIALGLFVGLLNMVPYLQNIAIIPAAFLSLMYTLETGNSFWGIFGLVAAVFVIVQIIQDGFLTPKIMGKAMNLNAAMILLSLSVWGKLLGVLGLLIALPMTYLLYSYYKQFLTKAAKSREIVEE